jgi:hypothetical protein
LTKEITMQRTILCAFLASAALVAGAPAMAHHGWAGNEEKDSELTGTVEQPVSLNGPHATMKIRVDGQLWDLTLAPPPRTEAAGLKADTLPKGAKVTVQGHRNKDPKRFEMKTERVTYEGRLYNVYPDRK